MMKCSRCSRPGVIQLHYFKESLCGGCFSGLFERRVKKIVRVNRLFGMDDKVVVGLSGCRDSMVLLFVLKRLFFKSPESRLFAVTVDDGFKGRVEAASALCRRLDVEHHVEKARSKARVGSIISSEARRLKADRIALGVNLEDDVSCVLEGMMKGIHEKPASGKARFILPLRELPEKEIEIYAKLNRISYVKPGKEEGRFKASLRRMLDLMEGRQPGIKFKLLKSVDSYRHNSV